MKPQGKQMNLFGALILFPDLGQGVMFITGYAVHCKMYKMYKRI